MATAVRPETRSSSTRTPLEASSLEEARRIVNAAVQALSQKINVVPLDRGANVPDYILNNPITISRAFVNGDHWQAGLGWSGPRPQITDPAYTETVLEIARQFVSKNVIGELVNRHVGGVLGSEPNWGFTPIEPLAEGAKPSPELQTLIDAAGALCTTWWDKREAHTVLRRIATKMLYAERGPARLYVPRGLLTRVELPGEDGAAAKSASVLEAATVEEAVEFIYLADPEPDEAAMVTNDDTKERVGVVLFRVGTSIDALAGTDDRAEVVFLRRAAERTDTTDRPMLTVIRSIGRGDAQEFTFDFGARLPIYEATRPLFVTPQMWQQQKALNLALTMQSRAIVTAGFLERTIMNAQMPGKWTESADGKTRTFIPEPYLTGPGTTSFLTGVELTDTDGNPAVATPTIHHREPTATTPLIEAARAAYADLLEAGSQEHVLAYQNAQASGKTHEQARADFVTSLLETQSRVEALGRWLLETLLAMAEEFSGQRGRFTSKLRAYFSCHLDSGPVLAEERKANADLYDKGVMSLETVLVRNGEKDPAAEIARIQKQPGGMLKLLERQTTVVLQLTQAGGMLEGAAELVGFDPAVIKKLVGDGTPPPTSRPPGDPAPAP